MHKRDKGFFKHLDFILLDLAITQLVFVLAYFLRHSDIRLYERGGYQNVELLLVIVGLSMGFFTENHKNILKRGYFKEMISVIQYTAACVTLVLGYLFFTKISDEFSRIVVFYFAVLQVVFLYAERLLWKMLLRKHLRSDKGHQKHLLVVTHSSIAEQVLKKFKSHVYEPVDVIGFTTIDDGVPSEKRLDGYKVVVEYRDLIAYVRTNWIDAVYIELPREIPVPEDLLNSCATMGVTTYQCIMQEAERNVVQSIEKVAGSLVLTESMNIVTNRKMFAKRVLDVIGATIGVLLTLVLTVLVGPFIFFADPGPIFFRQQRVGMNGKLFYIYKFRSMYKDAERRKQELMEKNTMQGLMFKMDNDPRILGSGPDGTKHGIGWFIRKTSIDEFPQFWNVLKGDMSLVGTRPPTVDEWEKYELHHRARLAMKPGITGLWQTSGRSEIKDFEEVIRLDLKYINTWTIAGDLRLILKTIREVLFTRGAK